MPKHLMNLVHPTKNCTTTICCFIKQIKRYEMNSIHFHDITVLAKKRMILKLAKMPKFASFCDF
ncbi:hypothetical protein EDS67_01310 [candidate division KSB1 bacterium]|nr:MAG: hypothetical protein EDS67_01310 [candidate division KSB1 bacterium]MCE7941694.1 hypothetical protein [Chlorobi bacterium CHB1]